MLEIKANKTLVLDGDKLDVNQDGTMKDLLLSLLGCPVEIDKDLTLGDFIHILYDIREFINLYCCEEYEVLRALVNAGRLAEGADYLKVFKNAEVTSDGFFKMNIQSDLFSYPNMGRNQNVCNLKMIFDPQIVDGDEILREGVEVKADYTLLEIIEVLYEDFLNSLRKDNILL